MQVRTFSRRYSSSRECVCSTLNDADFVVQSFHEPERDLVLWPAVGGDPVPMPIDHLGECLVGFEPLPLTQKSATCATQGGIRRRAPRLGLCRVNWRLLSKTRPPVLEESPRPALAFVVPELTEGLPEQVRRVQALVGCEHLLERLAAFEREVLATRKQRVLLALDVASIPATESAVLGLAHLVERIAQVAHDVELVVQNRHPRGSRRCHRVKRLPHVHHCQANAPGLALAEPVVEQRHACLFAILPPKPDRTFSNQVAHHDAIGMALADRDLVDADGFRSWRTRTGQLRPHVLHLQSLDRLPVKLEFLGDSLDGGLPAAPPPIVGKTLGIKRVVRQEVEPLALHLPATLAQHATHFDLQKDARVATRQIANAPRPPVVPTSVHSTAATADRFFERRLRMMTRAFGSPKTPRTVGSGRNPGNAYASQSRRGRFAELAIRKSSQFRAAQKTPFFTLEMLDLPPQFTHSIP